MPNRTYRAHKLRAYQANSYNIYSKSEIVGGALYYCSFSNGDARGFTALFRVIVNEAESKTSLHSSA